MAVLIGSAHTLMVRIVTFLPHVVYNLESIRYCVIEKIPGNTAGDFFENLTNGLSTRIDSLNSLPEFNSSFDS